MTDVVALGWTVAIVVLVAFAGWVHWLTGRHSKDRLMRCPETGSIAFVGVERMSHIDGEVPGFKVLRCDLWPERKDCARGCLARYDATAPGYRINPRA